MSRGERKPAADVDALLWGRLAPRVRLTVARGGLNVAIGDDDVECQLGTVSAAVARILARFRRGVTRAALIRAASVDERVRAELEKHLERLRALGALEWTLRTGGRIRARLIPVRPATAALPASPTSSARPTLSRFAHLRFHGPAIELHSPLADHVLTLVDHDLIGMLAAKALAAPATVAGMALAELLAAGGFLVRGAHNKEARGWTFESLLFHEATRVPRRGRTLGRVAEAGPAEPEPAAAIALPRPKRPRLTNAAPAFQLVMERRRSLVSGAAAPPDLELISELLFRAARHRGDRTDQARPVPDRPYPSAGALYPLTIYLVTERTSHLVAGLYRYAPGAHALDLVRAMDDDIGGFLEDARYGSLNHRPSFLVVFAARMARPLEAYGPIAYSLILKDVGVLMEALALTATAVGLAARPIGAGDATRFARCTGLDPRVETSVGELVVGRELDSEGTP